MHDKILNLPWSTSPAVHRSVLEIQKSDKKTTDKKNIDGEVNIHSPMGVTGNKTGIAPTRQMTKREIIGI